MPTDEQRARKREYMRRYREGRNRSAEGRLYWQKNREQILAKRKTKIETDEQRTQKRAYMREYVKKWREKHPEKAAKASREYNSRNPGRNSHSRVRRLEARAGRSRPDQCEVCGAVGRVAFDHCHRSGKFRGWLCRGCNQALGLVKDDPETLRKLITYLERTTL